MMGLPGRIIGWVVTVFTVIAAVFGVYLKGRSDATGTAKAEKLEEDNQELQVVVERVQDAIVVRQKTVDEVRNTDDQAARDELAERW